MDSSESKYVLEIQDTSRQVTEIMKQTSTLKMDAQEAVTKNKESLTLCVEEGQRLLNLSEAGMTPELDSQIASFIEKAKATSKAMTERRKKVTQVFDMVRKGFTAMENLVSVKSSESVVCQLQERRNKYAADILNAKRMEEEKRLRRERIEAAKVKLASDTKGTLNDILSEECSKASANLHELFFSLTLDNSENIKEEIQKYPSKQDFARIFVKYAPSYSSEVPIEEAREVMNAAFSEAISSVQTAYAETVARIVEDILMRFDSKIEELKEIKKRQDEIERKKKELESSADEERREKEAELKEAEEEQRRIQNEVRKADEAAATEQQSKIAEQSERRNDNLAAEKATAQAQALFNQTSVTTASEIKVKVTKHIDVLDRNGWLEIIQQWWTAEGASMADDKLAAKLDFMKKTCEKQANRDEIFIKSDHIVYIDDVKAK